MCKVDIAQPDRCGFVEPSWAVQLQNICFFYSHSNSQLSHNFPCHCMYVKMWIALIVNVHFTAQCIVCSDFKCPPKHVIPRRHGTVVYVRSSISSSVFICSGFSWSLPFCLTLSHILPVLSPPFPHHWVVTHTQAPPSSAFDSMLF